MQTLLQKEEAPLSYTFRLKKPSYEEASNICRQAGITSYAEYITFRKANPNYKLPSTPSQAYKEWTSIYDFLGTVPRNDREWSLYERTLKIKSGELVVERKSKTVKAQDSNTQVQKTAVEQKSNNAVEQTQNQVMTMLESGADFRALFVKMTKHYDVYEECKGAIRSLYTMDELLDRI